MLGKRVRADLALTVCALIWGATFVVVKDALSDASALLFLAARFTLAAMVMAALLGRSLRQLTPKSIRAGAQIGCFMFAGYVFQTIGLQFTTPAKAAFLTGFSVVLVPVLSGIFAQRWLSNWIWAGAFSALSGLYLLTVPARGLHALNQGDVLVFGCAVMFAFHILFIGRYARHSSVGALSFLQIATTAVLSLLVSPFFAVFGWERPHLVMTGRLLFAILITAIGATVIAFSLQVWAQQNTSATHTAILLSLEPVFAAGTSWLLAREHFGWRFLTGGALILSGILLAELKGGAPAAAESPQPA